MKEEIRWGRSKAASIELGFSRAFPSIRDSNMSSLITCGILYWFGSGPVRGFAVTLAIGILVSLFTAVTVTRTLLRLFIKSDK
jgi:preprotein translocase subunit SecD